MWKNNNRFKKLKLKKEKRKKKKRKTPQLGKSPTRKQRFMTTIKNVAEGEKNSKA